MYFVSRNKEKFQAARSAFEDHPIKLLQYTPESVEIQARTSAQIARATVLLLVQDLDLPVIREDHSFCIPFLKDFPGPFMAYVEKQITCLQLLSLLGDDPEKKAYFELSLAYADQAGRLLEYSYQVPVTLHHRDDLEPHQWASMMKLENEERFITDYSPTDRLDAFNDNFEALVADLQKLGLV